VTNDDHLSISVVIPAFNNETTIELLLRGLMHTLMSITDDFEIIVVDDGSSDGTFESVRSFALANPEAVRGVKLSRNFGQHPALSAGLELASKNWTVIMDADLEDNPATLRALFSPEILAMRPAIILTRVVDGQKPRRSSSIYHWLFGKLNSVPQVRDIGTLRAFDRRVRQALLQHQERSIVYGPLMATLGFSTTVVDVTRDISSGRKSSYTFKKRLALASASLMSHFELLGRLLIASGLCLGGVSFGYGVLVFVQAVLGINNPPAGVELLAILVSLSSGILMMSLGFMAAFLTAVLQEVKFRPRYLIEDLV
jgi:glycosyltransferase involved in cell wall biosynthesis